MIPPQLPLKSPFLELVYKLDYMICVYIYIHILLFEEIWGLRSKCIGFLHYGRAISASGPPTPKSVGPQGKRPKSMTLLERLSKRLELENTKLVLPGYQRTDDQSERVASWPRNQMKEHFDRGQL